MFGNCAEQTIAKLDSAVDRGEQASERATLGDCKQQQQRPPDLPACACRPAGLPPTCPRIHVRLPTAAGTRGPATTAAVLDMETEFLNLGLDIIGLGVFNYDFGSITRESPVIKVRCARRCSSPC